MKKQKFTAEKDGFYGVWYPNGSVCEKGVILMAGDSAEDRMAVSGAKWFHDLNCHVMAMAPRKNDYGYHDYPLERFGMALEFMKAQRCTKFGIAGASTTGMAALAAASYYPELTLTIAMSPSDFIMEGFYQDGRDGMHERPGEGESTLSWEGRPLPYLPYAYRHPEYWMQIKADSKASGDFIVSRKMFDESERRHPLQEEEKIKVERIRGKIMFIGAEDDVLWDTCRYIRRMEKRLEEMPHACTYESLLYEHGTHFVFPESMLKRILPVGSSLFVGLMFKAGRQYAKECRETRKDIDRRLKEAVVRW